MTALSTERLSPQMAGSSGPMPAKLYLPVKGSTKIYAGSLVVLNAGYAAPASAALGLVAVGKALSTIDNTTGSDGDLSIEVQIGVFRFENSSGGDAIAQANVGSMAYLADDQTVALTSNAGARSLAGQVLLVDTAGVWVLLGVGNVELLSVAALKQAQYMKVAADGAANTATAETAFARVGRTGTIVGAWYVPSAALTANDTDYATLALAKRDGAGGASASVASKATTTAGSGSWTAFVPVSLGTLSNTSVAAGNVLTFAISKSGSGVAVPAGTLIVAIAPALPRSSCTMIINGPNLALITQSVQVLFQKAYEEAPSDYLDQIATTVPSTTKTEVYPMVAEPPQLREWNGDRQAHDLATYDYSLTNKDFELTLKLDRNKILDDQYGIWLQFALPIIARQAKRKAALLVRDALRAGHSSACYDGQNFFDASHPINKFPGGGFGGTTQSNYFTSKALTYDNYRSVRASMMSFRGESGERFNVNPNKLVVPPSLEADARLILNSDMVAVQTLGNQTNVGGYSNPLKGSAEPLVLPDLAGDPTTWYLLDTTGPVKPLLWQKRQDPVIVQMFNPNDESVYRRKEFEFGVDMRGAAGYGPWWLAAKAVA